MKLGTYVFLIILYLDRNVIEKVLKNDMFWKNSYFLIQNRGWLTARLIPCLTLDLPDTILTKPKRAEVSGI